MFNFNFIKSVNNYEECIDNITSYYERISKLLIIKKLACKLTDCRSLNYFLI